MKRRHAWKHIHTFNVSPDIIKELHLHTNISIPTVKNNLNVNLNYISILMVAKRK